MGLIDRHYMRDGSARGIPSVQAWLVILVVNIIVFFAEFAQGRQSFDTFLKYGALSLDGVKAGAVWQFLTFQFLHDGPAHLVLNSVVLYSFGRPVEQTLGKQGFLKLYFLSGFAGGITQILLALVSPRFAGPMVGASAGICGLVAFFALLNPDSRIYLFFILPFRALYFLPLLVAVTVVLLVIQAQDHVAHGAHLGGLIAGVVYARWGEAFQDKLSRWRPFRARQRKREVINAASVKMPRWPRSRTEGPADPPSEEFISREVDPILDKISAHGIQSLTERERRILEAARNKMAKR